MKYEAIACYFNCVSEVIIFKVMKGTRHALNWLRGFIVGSKTATLKDYYAFCYTGGRT